MLGAGPVDADGPAGVLGADGGGVAGPRVVALADALGVAAAWWPRPEMSR